MQCQSILTNKTITFCLFWKQLKSDLNYCFQPNTHKFMFVTSPAFVWNVDRLLLRTVLCSCQLDTQIAAQISFLLCEGSFFGCCLLLDLDWLKKSTKWTWSLPKFDELIPNSGFECIDSNNYSDYKEKGMGSDKRFLQVKRVIRQVHDIVKFAMSVCVTLSTISFCTI